MLVSTNPPATWIGNSRKLARSAETAPTPALPIECAAAGLLKIPTLSMCFGAALLASLADAQTVDEIVAKNIQARGGLGKLKAVKTPRMTAQIN